MWMPTKDRDYWPGDGNESGEARKWDAVERAPTGVGAPCASELVLVLRLLQGAGSQVLESFCHRRQIYSATGVSCLETLLCRAGQPKPGTRSLK